MFQIFITKDKEEAPKIEGLCTKFGAENGGAGHVEHSEKIC